MKPMETIDIKLANHPFLKGMKPEHLAILARHAREEEFLADQVIFRQNENAHQFYLILEGRVIVETYVARTDNLPLQILNGGDVLGWSWLFPPLVWHFQARALGPARAILLDGASLLVACEQAHDFGFQLMQRIAQIVIQRLQAAQSRLLEIQKTAGPLPVVHESRRAPAAARMVAQSLEDMLSDHPFFLGLKAGHLKIVADAAMKATFDAGQVIFRKGDRANRFYLIQRGRVALESLGTETVSAPFEIIGDGDELGWSWLFPPFYSQFTARALEPTQSIFLYATRLREQCEQDFELGYALMKRTVAVVIQRLQATRGRLVEISALEEAASRKGELLAAKTGEGPDEIH
jgi:CRP/FNR family cyclic AMP-dependent transcriptional regulator